MFNVRIYFEMIVAHIVLEHIPHGLSSADKAAFWASHQDYFGPVRQYIDTSLEDCYNKYERPSWGVHGVRINPMSAYESGCMWRRPVAYASPAEYPHMNIQGHSASRGCELCGRCQASSYAVVKFTGDAYDPATLVRCLACPLRLRSDVQAATDDFSGGQNDKEATLGKRFRRCNAWLNNRSKLLRQPHVEAHGQAPASVESDRWVTVTDSSLPRDRTRAREVYQSSAPRKSGLRGHFRPAPH